MSLVATKNVVLPLYAESRYQTDSMSMSETISPSGALILDKVTRQDSLTCNEQKSVGETVFRSDLLGMTEEIRQILDFARLLDLLPLLDILAEKRTDRMGFKSRKRKGWDIVWGTRKNWLEE